ncbi:DUF309 domain-containing protein [Neobacillus sp. MM2021_6]|uniref:DUF309 domain-containing protein n=1 Tax=Bacillaceae TaxID=186817 RepID=UPI001409791D|nr:MULTISPECIES: DUF309 domain-containing protein [Bacillaceae]MBO0958908.1 DUF309 domain-containing protein [Neobacillus sp. MM2021_6]NHC17637.1 DUF309 domain-containing protein [Bacillus sp. MM2020_4]
MNSYPMEYYEFFVSFNEGDYYTCHDLLEEMWMTEKDNLFLKGLLQMSVAIYHYEYGNVKGARVMMQTAYDYLQAYRPKFWGLDLEKVYPFIKASLATFPKNIDRIPFEQVGNLPKLPHLVLYMEDD